MTKRDKYEMASESIVLLERTTCCGALHRHSQDKQEFINFFKPEDIAENDLWFGDKYVEENQLARSLALLFMAELDK